MSNDKEINIDRQNIVRIVIKNNPLEQRVCAEKVEAGSRIRLSRFESQANTFVLNCLWKLYDQMMGQRTLENHAWPLFTLGVGESRSGTREEAFE